MCIRDRYQTGPAGWIWRLTGGDRPKGTVQADAPATPAAAPSPTTRKNGDSAQPDEKMRLTSAPSKA